MEIVHLNPTLLKLNSMTESYNFRGHGMGGMRGGNPDRRGGGLGSGSTMDYGHMGGFGGFDEGFCFHSHKAASDAKR